MPLAQLIDATELAERLSQPDLRILDCRFSLDDASYGQRSYAQAHIPRAMFLDLEKDLSGPVTPERTGRHPLPDPVRLVERLRAAGLNDDSQVVLYDDGNGAFAARAWWLLAWLGKRDSVYLLNGGLKAWRDANGAMTDSATALASGDFSGEPDDGLVVDAFQVLEQMNRSALTLLDARALPRFLGREEPIDPVAGHIPGALCFPFTENMDASGRFLSGDELRERFRSTLAGRPEGTTVAYCGSGVTACHNLFAMCLAGYPLAKLYPGSWSEWITNPVRPISTSATD
ncbi:sulfurtransferase [Stutzerimonas zhaodongensis]|uniref:Sulfurtransferase n=1 Tax=Stutzerimonas zhaodongensis TaxID=1176257 RepID=A0A3M2HSA3_9GAMM|nr:sulfurtransferase [Stutzerimonas zhaodongensis]MCQ4316138.1 sulfurtransferase [Stutzerimonas zhaodongensis]RMH89802.1 sulfurtransferase [Stutzerimonas zhaodongensis]